MKFILPLPPLAVLTLGGLGSVAQLSAQAPTTVPPAVPAAGTRIEETTRTAVQADLSLDRREGKVDRLDKESNQIMLRTKLGKEPIGFTVTPATRFIDLDGKLVDPALIKVETPVEIQFAEDGNNLLASVVVVQRVQVPLPGGGMTLTTRETLKPGGKVVEETTKTTSIVHSGSIQTFEPGVFSVRVEGSPEPVRYQYSKTTTWVNPAGEPVSPDLIKAGLPVKVEYSKSGETMMANRVIIMVPAETTPGDRASTEAPKR